MAAQENKRVTTTQREPQNPSRKNRHTDFDKQIIHDFVNNYLVWTSQSVWALISCLECDADTLPNQRRLRELISNSVCAHACVHSKPAPADFSAF